MKYSDPEIIEGLKKGDTAVFKYILKKYFPYVKKYVCKTTGTREDSEDVLQEALYIIYKKKSEMSKSSFKAYFTGICKNIWLNHLRKRNSSPIVHLTDTEAEFLAEDIFQDMENDALQELKQKIYREEFAKLSENCRKMLLTPTFRTTNRETAESLNLSYEYVKKKKSESMITLINNIKNRLQKEKEKL